MLISSQNLLFITITPFGPSMHPEENILNFLKTYDKDNSVHRETYEMFKESNGNVDEIVSTLLNSGVNVENLQSLVKNLQSPVELDGENLQSPVEIDGEEVKRIKLEEDEPSEFEIPGLGESTGFTEDNPEEFEDRFVRYYSTVDNTLDDEDRFNKYDNTITNTLDDMSTVNKDRFIKYDNTTNLPLNNDVISNIKEDRYSNDTVFYQNILPIPSPKQDLTPASPDYLFPILQCKLCGLRFKDSSEIFTQHIEDHRRFTNALGEKAILRREFFTPRILHKTEKLDLSIEGEIEDVIWEKESPICSVCGKTIKKKWEDKLENWVLEDGVKINDKEVSHRKCVY